ncbi:MAG: FHA domain-containing protein [Pseudomonadota bacterium]
MELVVEVIGTTNNVLERLRFAQDSVRIGRGYSNDVILSDEHADVAHARLDIDEEENVWLEDLGSVNGTRRRKGRRSVQREQISSGDIFLIGRNRLRIYFANHELPAAVPLRPLETFLLWLGRSPVIATLLVIYTLVVYLRAVNSTVGDFEWKSFLGGQATSLLSFGAIVVGVYLVSVLFRRSGNFLSHVSVLLFVGVLSIAVSFVLELATFNGGDHSYGAISGLNTGVGYLFMFLYMWSVLYLAFNLSNRARTILSVLVVTGSIGLETLTKREVASLFSVQRFPEQSTFLPQSLQFASPLSGDQYDERVSSVFDAVDELRTERLEEREDKLNTSSEQVEPSAATETLAR